MAVQVRGELLGSRRVGSYHVLTITAPGVPEAARPGHFVALAVGGPNSAMLLRRAFSIHGVTLRGVYGGTIDIAVGVAGPGTQWLVDLDRHDPIDIVGPLGRPFALPKQPVSALLVGGGYGAAPLFMLAEELRTRGCRVDVVLGAASEDRLFNVLDAKRMASTLTITTDDGSTGTRGRVTDVLPEIMARTNTDVVYACGPMPMLAAVTELATSHGAHIQTAVEESMACGIGVCMTCVLPVIGDDGVTRMLRSCVDGPVFRGDRIRWDDLGTIPEDCFGAPGRQA